MPKLNVNDATREQLVETAGLRPAVVDALLEFRAEHGGKIPSPEALGGLPGVGPATLDQLRDALDFRDRGEKAGNGSDKGGNGAERETKQTAKAVEATTAAVGSGAKVAREATETGAQATAARSGPQLVERTAGAFGEAQRETARQSAGATAEFGRLFVELLSEQTRHNLEVATAFGRVANWGEIARLQGELVRASFERVNRLNGRYLEIVQDVMRATVSAAGQARKAA
jgi:hypothetical protein